VGEDRSTSTGRFTPAGIHPRTLEEVKPTLPVIVRDGDGDYLPRIATSSVTKGRQFLVVWVARAEEVSRALREGDVPEQVPWPATDVWPLAYDPRLEVPGADPR
jgi:hypothetical protein